MEWQALINIVAVLTSVIGVFIGWWVKSVQDTQKEIARDLKDVQISLPEHYMKKEDVNARLDKIDAVLERIFDKLETKADK